MRQFPYFDNYVDLTCLELDALASIRPEGPRKLAFIGSGSLPMSSLCIAEACKQIHGTPPHAILNIDRDPTAIELSSRLCRKLGTGGIAMEFQCVDAATEEIDLAQFDVVYLAALVGRNAAQKERIIAKTSSRMRAGALMVIRSSHSLRSLLYPMVDLSSCFASTGLELLMAIHPSNHIINSVIVARVRCQSCPDGLGERNTVASDQTCCAMCGCRSRLVSIACRYES